MSRIISHIEYSTPTYNIFRYFYYQISVMGINYFKSSLTTSSTTTFQLQHKLLYKFTFSLLT